MKFHVMDKEEIQEGLIFKKTIYYGRVEIELTPEEHEALKFQAKSRDWEMYPVCENFEVVPGKPMVMELQMFNNWTDKKTGVFSRDIRETAPEFREGKIEQCRQIATEVKSIIYARLDALESSDEDTSEEI